MSVLLVSVVGITYATAQSSEPVSTGTLTVDDADGEVSAGATIEVTGAGFAPGGTVDITIESDPVLLKTVRADAAGAFTTTVSIPSAMSSGSHTVKATGPDPAGGLRVLSMPVTVTGATSSGSLVVTGSELAPMVAVGIAAIVAGTAVLLLRRRRA